MPKHTLMPPVCSKRIHRRIHCISFSNVFSQKILINCVSLFLMLFSMFRSESLAIACSELLNIASKFVNSTTEIPEYSYTASDGLEIPLPEGRSLVQDYAMS